MEVPAKQVALHIDVHLPYSGLINLHLHDEGNIHLCAGYMLTSLLIHAVNTTTDICPVKKKKCYH